MDAISAFFPYEAYRPHQREMLELVAETAGKGGGLYLSTTHVIAPEVPHENLFAFVRAAKKYGMYS